MRPKKPEGYTVRNMQLARRAKHYGMKNSLRIVIEAKRVGMKPSLAFAVCEKESTNGANVWGHDPAPNGDTTRLGGRLVTARAVRDYLSTRGPRGRGGMQGVGPYQLTWYEFQDAAQRAGGLHRPKATIRVALTHLSGLVKEYGLHEGIKRYNGSGAMAEAYADVVVKKLFPKWHARLDS